MMKQIVANAIAKGGEPGPGVGAGRASTAGADARLRILIHHKLANAPAPSLLPTSGPAKAAKEKHRHTLAVLVVPRSTSARIANEAVLERAISITTDRLSVSIRANASEPCRDNNSGATLAEMRRYTSDVYEMVWDTAVESFADRGKLLDLVVYPQGMPGICTESAIELSPDLSCVCSHDAGIIASYEKHATDVNTWRALSGMESIQVIHVDGLPGGAEIARDPNVVFLEDDNDSYEHTRSESSSSLEEKKEDSHDIQSIHQTVLYSHVCIGGTFDGMHYGHRKLLTLAISSVNPIDGALSVGVKRDEMLSGKKFASLIPFLEERISGVLDFIRKLAPSMTNRVRCEPMDDASLQDWLLGEDFDALVVSSDTLPLGWRLNKYRQDVLGLEPVHLLCTQRTMAHGMSSTALRKLRSKQLYVT